jgi:hypothetical protein
VNIEIDENISRDRLFLTTATISDLSIRQLITADQITESQWQLRGLQPSQIDIHTVNIQRSPKNILDAWETTLLHLHIDQLSMGTPVAEVWKNEENLYYRLQENYYLYLLS